MSPSLTRCFKEWLKPNPNFYCDSRLYLHARHELLLLSFVKQLVDVSELQQGLGHRRRFCFVHQVIQSLEHVLKRHPAQSARSRRWEDERSFRTLTRDQPIYLANKVLKFIPGKGKDVVYERGAVLRRQNADIVGEGVSKSCPAVLSVVHHVEARVSVVHLKPLHTFWHFKRP